MVFSKSERMYYGNLINCFAQHIDKHMIDINKEGEPIWESKWCVGIYLDACHSGSALGEGVTWAKKYGARFCSGDEEYKVGDTSKKCFVTYFQEKVWLYLKIMASASEPEFAMDAGEGMGGRWSNHFFAKGKTPCIYDAGKKIAGVAAPGEKPPT